MRQLWKAVSFDKNGLTSIMFSKQHQHISSDVPIFSCPITFAYCICF